MRPGLVCLLILILAVLFNGCEQGLISPGPQVHFTVGELLYVNALNRDTVILGDTVLTDTQVVFKATDEYKSYKWKIGKRTFDTREVTLSFQGAIAKLPVRLVAFNSPNGADSVIATDVISVIGYWNNPIFGTFRGSNQSTPGDLFDVLVSYESDVRQINISNINQGCNPVVPSVGIEGFDVSVGYKTIFFSSGFYYQGCNDPSGWVTLDRSGNKMTIDYTVGTGTGEQTDGPRVRLQFIGNRKQ